MRKIFVLAAITLSASLSNQSYAENNNNQIYMHAHRGEPTLAPQNTTASIKLAFELGARMIETDFHLTEDGTIVCMHGRNELKSLWGIDKDPSKLTREEIAASKLRTPEKFDKKYADCKIPTIDQIFAIIPKDKYFELEIKHYGKDFADKVEDARKKAGLKYSNMIVTSFSPNDIKDFKKKYPEYETLYILSINSKNPQRAEDVIKIAKDAGASQVAIGNYRAINREYVKKIQDSGLKVGVWQVENLDDLAYAIDLGANRICSNNASKLRANYAKIQKTTLR